MDTENKNSGIGIGIDLVELFGIIWKRKYIIVGFVFIMSVLVVITTLMMDNIYASKAVLKPSLQSSQQNSAGGLGVLAGFAGLNLTSGNSLYGDINVLLADKHFLAEFVKKHELASKLVENPEDLTAENFKRNEIFNYFNLIRKSISVSEDKATKYITVSFESKDPQFSKDAVDLLLVEISNVLRTQQMGNLEQRIENYKLEIDRAADMTLKTKLSELVANLIQNKVLASADVYYGFDIISQPYIAEPMDKVGPRRGQICIVVFLLSFVLASIGVVVFEEFFVDRRKRAK